MSLNGLEATEVNDAYQAALGEGGGWFLLKYTSRDEVGLLEKGNGGLAELEEVVNRFEEQSPLYGFIQYRRRKVILKYIPDGTSRLLQARVTVQFQSVVEKLSPHDTVYSFTQSAELRDSALSSACSLHTATASIKSSNDSLPRRGLAGITEDASEFRVDTVEGQVVLDRTTRDEEQSSGAEDFRTGPEKVNGSTSADRTHHRSTSATTQGSFRQRTTSNTDKSLPPPPPAEDQSREDTSPGSVLDYGDYNARPSMDGRFSSISNRPSTRDLYDAYGYKKKARLGPRPSADSAGTSNNLDSRSNEFRPVSTLPAGLRMPPRKAVPSKSASQQAQASNPTRTISPVRSRPPAQANSPDDMTPKKAATATIAPVHIPDRNVPMQNNGLRTPKMLEPGSPKMTPEKQRLMKALQLRQKQIAARDSVNGLGIKRASEEAEFSRPEIDDSILSAVIDASISTEGLEPVHLATKDLAKEESRILEDSPISVPGTAEEPSTKASSITDEEEPAAQQRHEHRSTSISTISEHHDLLSDSLLRNHHPPSNGSQVLPPEDSKRDVLEEAAATERVLHLNQLAEPTQFEVLATDKDVAEQKPAGKELPEFGQYDQSPVIDKKVPNDEKIAKAEEVHGDMQLSPSQFLRGQASSDQSTAGDRPPLFDREIISTVDCDENREVHQSEPLDDHEKAASVGELSKNIDILQCQLLGGNETGHHIASPDDHTQVLQSQSEEGDGQSVERPVHNPNEAAPGEVPNNIVKPLLVRRSSSSKSIAVPSDNVSAHEVPLPPIDEDEEISLSPQPALFREQTAKHPLDSDGESNIATLQTRLPSRGNDHSATLSSTSKGVGERQIERQYGSQRAINAMKRVSSPDQSDEQFLSDDSFMEELKSATVQEAKPVSVSKSPIKPVFSRSESEQRLNGSAKNNRSVSTPVDRSAKDEEVFSSPRLPTPLSTPRSSSVQPAPRPDSQQSQVPLSKKIGVSSSISQRIKALEQLSSRPTSPTSAILAPNKPTFLGLRKTSVRTPSGGSNYRNSDLNRSRPITAYPSPSPSPETVKSSLFSHSNKPEYSHPIKSVTTTVDHNARDNSSEIPFKTSEPRHLDLHESLHQPERQKSPTLTEHKTMGPPPLSPLKPPRPRFGRYSSTRSGSSSSNEQKLEPPPTTRRDSFASIRSKSSRAGSEVELPHTLSDSSLSGAASLDGTQDEKKDSRRSRLLKRMSSISSMSRRSIAHALSPGPKEAPIIERQEPIQEAPSTSVDVGDLNVQFPDTLLWKRRHMVIDASGVLVLSASKSDNNSKVMTKRYPISEFCPPYIPDQDRQELPNSVVLDFKDGSTLQCACEHLQGQAGVLKALRHAHSTYQSQ